MTAPEPPARPGRNVVVGLIVAGLLAAGLGGAALTSVRRLSTKTPDDYGDIYGAVWISVPSQGEIAAAYPSAAEKIEVFNAQPEAVIRCFAAGNGGLIHCAILSESPDGYGFGAAALALTPHMRMDVVAKDGTPVAGRAITVPVKFPLKAPSA